MKYDVESVEMLINEIITGRIYFFQFWEDHRACKFEKDPRAERFIKTYLENTGVSVGHSHCGAFYYYGYDRITIVPKCWFRKPKYYYRTMLHEMAHSTACKKRLDRKYGTKEDSHREEIISELTAYIIMKDLYGYDDEAHSIMISYCMGHDAPLRKGAEDCKAIAEQIVECCDYIYENAGGRELYCV